jgi:hypothetical protein
MEKTFDMPVKKPLTGNEIKFIKKNRLKMSSGDIAIALGRGDRIIQMFLIDNGLKVPKTVWLKLRQQKLKGKTKNKLLKIKLKDLRHIRFRKNKF